MESVLIAMIVAVVTGTLSPALLLYMKSKSESRQRREDAEIRKAERAADWAREDAREARAHEQLAAIKKQTDGVVEQVAALAKSTGRIEGEAHATRTGEATAATLALGQQQGRDAERESAATHHHNAMQQHSDDPLPVADDRTATAAEKTAAATEVLADATARVADAAEVKK